MAGDRLLTVAPLALLLRGTQLSRANSSAHTELFLIDMLPVSAIGLKMVAAENLNLVEVAALVGDTARATMLSALMGGRSLTAKELAYYANVARSTASGHLSKLVAARLLTVFASAASAIIGSRPRWSRQCWRASRSSPRWSCHPAVSRGQQTTMHCVLPEVA